MNKKNYYGTKRKKNWMGRMHMKKPQKHTSSRTTHVRTHTKRNNQNKSKEKTGGAKKLTKQLEQNTKIHREMNRKRMKTMGK